jgi:RND family efflux transporter MFP subunit
LAIWKQLLVVVVALCAVGFAVLRYVPGGRIYFVKLGLISAASDTATAATDAAPSGQGGGKSASPGGGQAGARTALVVVNQTTEATINDRLIALGTGAAVQSATLTPSSNGILTEVRVTSGADVTARDVIATLDPASAQVAYDAASIANDDAQKTLDRFNQLGSSSSVSATQLQAFKLAADKAELSLRQARIDLDNREVVSPIAGTIGIILVNPGVEVTQSTVIATVEDTSAIKVNFDLPERFVGKVNPGDPVTAVPIAQPETTFEAVVTALDNRVDEASGSFKAEALIPNSDGKLRSGMSFTMTMRFPGDTYVAVPPLAVQWGSDGAYVWRVVDHVAHRVNVSIIQRNAENVLLSGDLALGDQVVTEGLDNLKDGMTVKVVGEQPATGPAKSGDAKRIGAAQPVGAAEAGPAPGTSPAATSAPARTQP